MKKAAHYYQKKILNFEIKKGLKGKIPLMHYYFLLHISRIQENWIKQNNTAHDCLIMLEKRKKRLKLYYEKFTAHKKIFEEISSIF